jgi:cytochrome b6-f complex iron-sulfur subunit
MTSETKPPPPTPSAPDWPSPWPYDFPADGSVPAPADKIVRVIGSEPHALVVTRRKLFSAAALGWAAFATATGIGSLGLVRMLFPNVVFEPPMRFRTLPPARFAPNTVDTTWKESNAVWIVHVEGRIIALSTVCTHLGCTPNWLASESKFKCPCHGSGYYMNGVNFEGPAPRPLERYRVSVNPVDGFLWVDKTQSCRLELGTCDDRRFYIAAA